MNKDGYSYKKLGNKYFIRVDKDTEIIRALKEICTENNITAGEIIGICAIKSEKF